MWNNSGDLTAGFGSLPEYSACVCLNCDNDVISTAPYHSDRTSLGWSSAIQLQSAQDIECVYRAVILRPSGCLDVGERRDCDSNSSIVRLRSQL